MWVEILIWMQVTDAIRQSSSSWGCELKLWIHWHEEQKDIVILFVRMWVEIPLSEFQWMLHSCHPLREDVSWNSVSPGFTVKIKPVILFVRMWVEISFLSWDCLPCMSSSSWGCELKYTIYFCDSYCISHPLREDVSWNIFLLALLQAPKVILFVRMWVEIEIKFHDSFALGGHPLREDVSWNWKHQRLMYRLFRHPLREDVSWNIMLSYFSLNSSGHPLREDVSWNTFPSMWSTTSSVILFVRMWVEIISARNTIL